MTLSSYNYLTERALFVAFGQFFTMLEGSPVAERGMGAVSEELGRLVHFDMELRCAWTELFDNNLWARERLVSGDPRTSFSPASVVRPRGDRYARALRAASLFAFRRTGTKSRSRLVQSATAAS